MVFYSVQADIFDYATESLNNIITVTKNLIFSPGIFVICAEFSKSFVTVAKLSRFSEWSSFSK